MSSRFRTLQILLMVCGWLPLGAAEWRTTVPFTYNIEYGKGHVGNPRYLQTIAEAPPTLLHVGEDIPFSSTFGTVNGAILTGPRVTLAMAADGLLWKPLAHLDPKRRSPDRALWAQAVRGA